LHAASSPALSAAAPAGPGEPPATVLAAPLPAPSQPQSSVAASIPRAGSAPPPSERGERSKVPLIAGVVLGVVALAIAGTFVWMDQRPHHAPVKVVPFDASRPLSTDEDAGTVAPDITLAPVLAPPSGVKVPWWKDPDAATPTGEPRECAIARWQKDAGRPSSSWEPLEAKCRAAGGKP
jgi:hypothetical protein